MPAGCRDGATFNLRWTLQAEHIVQTGATVIADEHHGDGRADDGGAMSTAQHLEAHLSPDAIRASVSASVVWTRASDGRVLECEAAPLSLTFSRMN